MAEYAMPVAHPAGAADPVAFYGTFAGKLTAAWVPGAPLAVRLDAAPAIAAIHAPMKSAMRFVPVGALIDGVAAAADTVVLATWPKDFLEAKETLGGAVPAEIRIANVDAPSVQAFATAQYATMAGSSAADVAAFMAGSGLLRVLAGKI